MEQHEAVPDFVMPMARLDGVKPEEIGTDFVIYDELSHTIHHLNDIATTIWKLCDGSRSINAIGLEASTLLQQAIDERTVRIALTKLEDVELLKDPLPPSVRLDGMNRRRFLKRSAGTVAIPIIASISAPAAAAAASGCKPHTSRCFMHSECCSGYCDGDGRFEGRCIGN